MKMEEYINKENIKEKRNKLASDVQYEAKIKLNSVYDSIMGSVLTLVTGIITKFKNILTTIRKSAEIFKSIPTLIAEKKKLFISKISTITDDFT